MLRFRTIAIAALAAVVGATGGCTGSIERGQVEAPAKLPPDTQLAAGDTALVFSDGDRYVGAVQNGQPNGHGVYTWADGNNCDGSFKDGVLNGHATCHTPSGTYSGEFRDGGFGLHHPN